MKTARPWVGLYAIVDVDAWRKRGVELGDRGVLEAIVDALADASPTRIQLRGKHESKQALVGLAMRLGRSAKKRGIAAVVNDSLTAALMAYNDGVVGVHLGQEDPPCGHAHRVVPQLAIGLSTHDRAQLEKAIVHWRDGDIEHAAIGPIFETTSKERPDATVGLDGLKSIAARANEVGLPLVAIGGIDRARAPSVATCGVRCAAVVSDLVVVDATGRPDLPEISARAREIAAVFRA